MEVGLMKKIILSVEAGLLDFVLELIEELLFFSQFLLIPLTFYLIDLSSLFRRDQSLLTFSIRSQTTLVQAVGRTRFHAREPVHEVITNCLLIRRLTVCLEKVK